MKASARNHIVMVTLGTLGDILPFVQMAKLFLERGYRVSILTSSNWKELVIRYGAEFVEIADPDPHQDDPAHKDTLTSHWYPSFRRSFEYIEKFVDHQSALVLYWVYSLGAECASIKFKIPSVKIVLQPYFVFSFIAPPYPYSLLEETYPGWLAKYKGFLGSVMRMRIRYSSLARRGNRFRKSVGCQPVVPKVTIQRFEDLILYMFPEWYAPPQIDWPSNGRCVGFPSSQAHSEDVEITAFIKRFGPPIVFTPGTGIKDPSSFFEAATKMCARLNAPGIFLHPAAPTPPSDDILTRPFLSLDSFLPFARLFVHHGGIGSTAAAIRAGIPQIICAAKFDQPDNAQRVTKLQIGRSVPQKGLNADKLCQAFVELEADEGLPERLAKNRVAALECNGDENAVDAIIALLSEPNGCFLQRPDIG